MFIKLLLQQRLLSIYKMKIGFYVKTYNGVKGGIERLISMLAHELTKDNDITIFMDCEKWEKFPYPLPENVNQIRLPFRTDTFFIKELNEIIVSASIEVMVVMRTGSKAMQIWAAALSGTSCKLVMSEHCAPEVAKIEYPNNSRDICLECADHIHLLQDEFICSIPMHLRKRVEVISNYVTDIRSHNLDYCKRKNQIVMIGRLTKTQKRPLLLAEAFKVAQDKNSEIKNQWKLIFCGDGPEKDSLNRFIRDNNLNNVEVRGQVENVEEVLQESKLFCLPSAYEGQSIALMEAMNCGAIPIVLDDAPGNRSMVSHLETGYLAKKEKLSETILEAISNPNNENISINAQKFIAKFSKENALNKWKCLFSKAIREDKNFRERHQSQKKYLINSLLTKEVFNEI